MKQTFAHQRVIMGGSQSTGSSLLVNILNRHSQIISGPETYLFIHPKLYKNWKDYKKYLIKTNKIRGLKSQGWFMRNGAILDIPFYGWNKKDLKDLILSSSTFQSFIDAYMHKSLEGKKANTWVEKSPANTICFDLHLKEINSAKVIHCTRNPYDAISSIIARGYSPYYAVGTYVTNTALALRSKDNPNYFLVKYEELVQESTKTLSDLMKFLEYPMESSILHPTQQEKEKVVTMKGWKNSEKDSIKNSSIGRFTEESIAKKNQIIEAVHSFQINDAFAKKFDLNVRNAHEIGEVLSYEIKTPKNINASSLRHQKIQDQWFRAKKAYPFLGADYPGSLIV